MNNYYDELIKNIEELMKNNKSEAKKLVDEELSLPYIPKDIEDKLLKYNDELKENNNSRKSLDDEEIIDFLHNDEQHQLIAVDELGRRNLRDYIDICEEYLKGNGFVNAKALLIDSLIKQEINYEFEYVNNSSLLKFNPSKLEIIEKTEEFNKTIEVLNDNYFKDPSKLQLAIQLAYKEAILSLPNKINCKEVSENIINYIDDAFAAK